MDTESQNYGSFCCFLCLLLLFLPLFLPPSAISCGDLSFPAGPMLISYWSSGLRVGVYEMDVEGEAGGGELWGCLGSVQTSPPALPATLQILKCEHANGAPLKAKHF